jgi:NhaP-type Na+/H+ or K+/H+ antiporter
MIYQYLTIIAAFLLFYSLFAGRFELRMINGPMMFLLAGFILGAGVLDVLSPSIAGQGFRLLAELTLAIVLFTDAANANLAILRVNNRLPLRLLLIGLPLTLLAGWAFGLLVFPDAPWLEMAILSTILAPTDAALGKAVVSNPAVPAPTREALNVESGLNDGICVPVLFLFLTLLVPGEEQVGTLALATHLIVEEIGIGVVTAVVLALLTTRPDYAHRQSRLGLAYVAPANAARSGGAVVCHGAVARWQRLHRCFLCAV